MKALLVILDHVGIDVGDLDRSARFWMALLGLEVEERSDPHIFFRKQSDGPGLYLQKVPGKEDRQDPSARGHRRGKPEYRRRQGGGPRREGSTIIR